MLVTLDKWEQLHATTIGAWRQLDNARRSDAHGFTGNGHDAHIDGALAELAVAKALNVYWSGVRADPFDLPGDCGHLQVRSTRHRSGKLIVHPTDPDECAFVLVIASPPSQFLLAGWAYAADAKSDRWWADPTGNGRHVYFVPQSALCHDLEVLRP